MRKRWAALILLVVLGLATAPYGMLATAQDGTEAEPACADCAPEVPAAEYVPGELLVRFQPAVSKARAAEVISAEGASHSRGIPVLGVQVLRLPPGLPVEEAVVRFNRRPEVDYAEPNYILQIAQSSDPGLGKQWAPQKIGAPQAWAYTKGSPEVIIAIVDTGVDYDHPELSPNRWTNLVELNGTAGQDDDGNGCIDDVRGCNFVNGDGDPMDDHFHGTHVAGIVAAAENDIDAGLVGICPNCTFMAVKVLDADGYGDEATVAEGIIYAADNGAKVISLSLRMLTAGNEPITLRDAVNHAWNQGAVVVAATGNDSMESGQLYGIYPAGHANAMGVVATDEDDYRSCYANYGSDLVSVAAPGDLIHSTVPGGGYDTYSGTSMAAPHVSGLAGLLFSYYPDNDNAWVRTRIEGTTDYFAAGASDAYLGTGRINAYAALSGDDPLTTPPPGLLSNSDIASGYAHARKLVREAGGTLHVVWHTQAGGKYQVLYATSNDNGANWSAPEVVFSSTAETYHPALAVDDDYVYIAFPTKHGASTYRTFFRRLDRSNGSWFDPGPLTGTGYDAVLPVLYLDPANGRLHMVASSRDNAPYVYYAYSADQGGQWSPAQAVDPNEYYDSSGNTRYAAIHANGPNIYIVARTVDRTSWTKYYTTFVRSTNGGQDWTDHEKLASWTAFLSGEYGLSLAGVGDRLYMGYEVGGGLYFREYNGVPWGDNTWVDLKEAGAWPSITQAADGQAWMVWENGGSLKMRHYNGSNWAPAETVLAAGALNKGYYPNLKLGTSRGWVEWVYTSCKGSPYSLAVGGRFVGDDAPPTVGIDDPGEDETLRDTHRVLVSASDDNQLASVALSIDGGAYEDITGNVQGAQYYYDWDTTTGYPDGSHTLQARATDNAAQSTGSAVVNVTVDNATNAPPVASFAATCTGLVCDFDASGSYDPDGSINRYDWTFGDGQTGTGARPSHTYASAGTRSVILTVTDSEGATDSDVQEITVQEGGAGTVHVGDLDATKKSVKNTWTAAVTIEVHDGSHGPVSGATVTGSWSDGAGGTGFCTTDANGVCTLYKYDIPKKVSSAVFTVSDVSHATLTVTYKPAFNHDPDGDSDGTRITVPPPANQSPVATFTFACTDHTCDFDASGSYDLDGPITTYTWDFGDGTPDTGIQTSHTYAVDGQYTVALVVTDDLGATGTDSQLVTLGTDGGGGTMHVGDLDPSSVLAKRDTRWDATVTITVHDGAHALLSNATVMGAWSDGATGTVECTTGDTGRCDVTKASLKLSVPRVTFTVTGVKHALGTYSAGANHDPDEDSNGTEITVSAP